MIQRLRKKFTKMKTVFVGAKNALKWEMISFTAHPFSSLDYQMCLKVSLKPFLIILCMSSTPRTVKAPYSRLCSHPLATPSVLYKTLIIHYTPISCLSWIPQTCLQSCLLLNSRSKHMVLIKWLRRVELSWNEVTYCRARTRTQLQLCVVDYPERNLYDSASVASVWSADINKGQLHYMWC